MLRLCRRLLPMKRFANFDGCCSMVSRYAPAPIARAEERLPQPAFSACTASGLKRTSVLATLTAVAFW